VHSTQISLEDEQYQALLRKSRQRQKSLSAVICELFREHLPTRPARENPLDKLAGSGEGTGEPVGKEQGQVLYGKDNGAM
jgi:hypothetical protein